MIKRKHLLSFMMLTLGLLVAIQHAPAQTKYIGYQAVVRKADGKPVANANVTVKITLNKESATGEELYTETHDAVATSASGLINLEIGSKDEAKFATINWAEKEIWLNVEVTATQPDQINVKLSQRLQAVPYAYYAHSVEGLDSKVDKADFDTQLAAKADKADLDAKADKTALDDKADKTALDAKADKTALDAKADKAELTPINKKVNEVDELKVKLAKAEKMLELIKTAVPAVQQAVEAEEEAEKKRVAIRELFNSKEANVEVKYVTAALDANYAKSLDGVVTGGWEIDPTFAEGPSKGSFSGKMKLEFEDAADGLKMHMTQNAMGLNDLALYAVAYNTLGYNTLVTPYYTMTLEQCEFYDTPIKFTLKDLTEILDWHKTTEKIGDMNVILRDIVVDPADVNNISKLHYLRARVNAQGETKTNMLPLELEYSPFTKLKAMYDDPNDPNHEKVLPLGPKEGDHILWKNNTPYPYIYFANFDYDLLGDPDEDNFHPSDPNPMDDLSKITGSIDWNTKEITFRFPVSIDQHSTWIYVDVKITPGQ